MEDNDLEILKKRMADLQKKKEKIKMEKEAQEEKERLEAEAEKAKKNEDQNTPLSPKEEKQGFEIFVGKLHPRVTKEQLMKHFECCGEITRCTIRENPYTHQSYGYAYLTFAEKSGHDNALLLNETLLGSQMIEVKEKRDNKPNMGRSSRRFSRRRFRRQ